MNFKSITAGRSRSFALLEDGSAWVWGNVKRRELTPLPDELLSICGSGPLEIGHGRYAQSVPQRVHPKACFVALADAGDEFLAIDQTQRLARFIPYVSVDDGAPGLTFKDFSAKVRLIAGNERGRFALDDVGTLWSWGMNVNGLLGRSSERLFERNPSGLDAVHDVVQVVTGESHVLVLDRRGGVWAWGANAAGQLGLGHLEAVGRPTRLNFDAPIKSLAAGDTHSLAIDERGRVYAWGSNHHGQLGPIDASVSTMKWSATPLRLKLGFKPVQMDAGMHFTVALSPMGDVYAWGWNGFSQLADATISASSKPLRVNGLSRVRMLSAGASHVLAVSDQTLWAWGDNRNSTCGSSPRQQRFVHPQSISIA